MHARTVSEEISLTTIQRIYVTETGELITAIEILSPVNKQRGRGIEAYRRQRSRLLQSPVHLIEIDLLRKGTRPGPEANNPPLEEDYLLLVNRDNDGEQRISEIWPVALNEALPLPCGRRWRPGSNKHYPILTPIHPHKVRPTQPVPVAVANAH